MTASPSRLALISVTDKTGVIEFAKKLVELSFSIISTGGTANLLREAGIAVRDVADLTGSPEVLGGRVKTLHPMIHGGILADRSHATHLAEMARMNWQGIDIVAVNLYDFAGEAKSKNLSLDKAIEYIDIGGPAMLRAAAKNHAHCLPVIDPSDYDDVIAEWREGPPSKEFRTKLAKKVFQTTSAYDGMIARYFASSSDNEPAAEALPGTATLDLRLAGTLRYGENSHQKAAIYQKSHETTTGLAAAIFLQGKELSYNNYVDLDAASAIVSDLAPLPAMTIIKHTNPCGTAASATLPPHEIFARALSSDPKCAFGGIVASNIRIDELTARAMSEIFLECVIAPDYSPEALGVFASKKNLRVLKSNVVLESGRQPSSAIHWRSINGALLAQTADTATQNSEAWTCVTASKPTAAMLADLVFTMTVCKHVKSNAIVLGSAMKTIGVGAGQMSRVDSVRIAIEKARELGHIVKGSVLASDAFFPFRDSVDDAARAGIAAIVQPGGSIRDKDSIEAANEHGIVMMTTGIRHFKH